MDERLRTAPLPTGGERTERRGLGELFPAGFTLFADMLLVGLLTSAACLPVLTAPAAFAAASRSVRSAAQGTPAGARAYFGHLRAHLSVANLAAGLLPPLFSLVLLVDAALLRSSLPGSGALAPALALTALGAAVVGLRATALEAPHRLSARAALTRAAIDPRGTLLLAVAVLLAAALAWCMPLLLPLLPGPLAFAATVVDLNAPTDGQAD